jgi:hypothetical protein
MFDYKNYNRLKQFLSENYKEFDDSQVERRDIYGNYYDLVGHKRTISSSVLSITYTLEQIIKEHYPNCFIEIQFDCKVFRIFSEVNQVSY